MGESRLHDTLKRELIRTKLERVENAVNLGTPDMYFTNLVNIGWIEAKYIILPVRETTQIHIPFRAGQYPWLMDNYKHGGLSILGIVVKDINTGFFFAVNENIRKAYDYSCISIFDPNLVAFVPTKQLSDVFEKLKITI